LAQVEIFGPVLVAMTFRTPGEAVALANNTRYGLAASVWTQDIDQALDVARGIQAGTVWINSTNVFDASSGFGGYRESGYGREGGREGLFEYVQRVRRWGVGERSRRKHSPTPYSPLPTPYSPLPPIDRTPKQFIGGKQARPDSGYSRFVYDPAGNVLGEVGDGNRKDLRNAVEAARAAASTWATSSGYNRAQILYYLAENLSVRGVEFGNQLQRMTGCSAEQAALEVEASIERLFTYAAWADKFEGVVHVPPIRGAALAVPEPIGVMGIVCPDTYPLLGLVSLAMAPVSQGNAVVVVPSEQHPLSGTDLYQVLETSDVPAGVINIVTGQRDPLAKVLAEHDDVDALWYVGTAEGRQTVETASVGNMKRTWTELEAEFDPWQLNDRELLRETTHVKNIWIPWGS
jgi:aldehyde dehydrogenase (NAD+)